jgi:hypothetical protein
MSDDDWLRTELFERYEHVWMLLAVAAIACAVFFTYEFL